MYKGEKKGKKAREKGNEEKEERRRGMERPWRGEGGRERGIKSKVSVCECVYIERRREYTDSPMLLPALTLLN